MLANKSSNFTSLKQIRFHLVHQDQASEVGVSKSPFAKTVDIHWLESHFSTTKSVNKMAKSAFIFKKFSKRKKSAANLFLDDQPYWASETERNVDIVKRKSSNIGKFSETCWKSVAES